MIRYGKLLFPIIYLFLFFFFIFIGFFFQSTNIKSESKEPEKPVSRSCNRCIQLDVQMQRQKLKIDLLEVKCEDRRKNINYLRSQVSYYKEKLRLLQTNFAVANSPPTYESSKCKVCHRAYLSCEQHICDGRDVITCDYCDQSFNSIIGLMDHLSRDLSIDHAQKEFHKCDKCHRIYAMPLLLSFHDKQHTSVEPRLICDICDKRCYTVYQMKNHMDDRHSGKPIKEQPEPFQCGSCGKYFTAEKYLQSHVKKVHDKMSTGQFECFICKMKLMSLHDTRIHLLRNHKRSEKCMICNMPFTMSELNKHLCSGLKIINCCYCHKSFNSMKHLLHHLEQECKPEKLMYKCEICRKYFGMKIIRDIHVKHHIGTPKPYSCVICSKSFATRISLLAHKKIHVARGEKRNSRYVYIVFFYYIIITIL